jgi:hypothetical protein
MQQQFIDAYEYAFRWNNNIEDEYDELLRQNELLKQENELIKLGNYNLKRDNNNLREDNNNLRLA